MTSLHQALGYWSKEISKAISKIERLQLNLSLKLAWCHARNILRITNASGRERVLSSKPPTYNAASYPIEP